MRQKHTAVQNDMLYIRVHAQIYCVDLNVGVPLSVQEFPLLKEILRDWTGLIELRWFHLLPQRLLLALKSDIKTGAR